MRPIARGPVLDLRAIAGLHVVVLAWDFAKELSIRGDGLPPELADLLGFAIEREELDREGKVIERYALRGIKRFRSKDEGLPPGTPVPLYEHPVQSFCWADYTVRPATSYTYRLVPMRGAPRKLERDDAAAVAVALTTEAEWDTVAVGGTDEPRHDVYFNRGVIGSQAYARKFANVAPDPDRPGSEPMRWLSRGLYEALLGFIGRARDDRDALRAAFYEFRYLPVARALREALKRHADVKIVFDAESSYKAANVRTLEKADLLRPGVQFPRTVTEGIRHNKFIVLLHDEKPVAVWTGSTNISAGGIFGQSNVGHVVWDARVAGAYLAYWQRLADDLTPGKLRGPDDEQTPTPRGKPPPRSVLPLFSPRDGKDGVDTLQWYADRMADARRIACLTVAFNLDARFQEVIARENDVLRYVVKDKDLGKGETIGRDRDVLFAGGGRLEEGALANFLRERDNPLNTNDYIHTKLMLVDPLGKDPLVVTGSANFSRPSQRSNDENMLVIRGDTRVADIYFGEFMRIFDHHYARYVVRKLQASRRSDPSAGYLKEKAADWVRPHFDARSYKSKRRRYFMEE